MASHTLNTTAAFSPLLRYVTAAILARMATGGAPIALVLLGQHYQISGKMTGLLIACLSAPHILGPVYGRWLDSGRLPGLIISAATLMFPLSFVLAGWGFAHQAMPLSILALLLCGCCSSFMMGGLSSQLTKLTAEDINSRRHAQSWDTATYGLGLTFGPMLIGTISTQYHIDSAIWLLMVLPVIASLIILVTCPAANSTEHKQKIVPGFRQIIASFFASLPLKRTLVMTMAGSFSVAALPVISVYLAEHWHQEAQAGAWLVTSYGVGCLTGAGLLLLRPMRADAVMLLGNLGWLLLATLLFILLSNNYLMGLMAYWLCGTVNSCFFAATLAARTEHAPTEAAAQIYLWVAAAKISAASLGAFAAGLLADLLLHAPLLSSVVVLALSLLFCFAFSKKRV